MSLDSCVPVMDGCCDEISVEVTTKMDPLHLEFELNHEADETSLRRKESYAMRLPEEIKIEEEPDETEADTVEAEPSHSEVKKCKTVLRDHQKVKKSNRGSHLLYVDTERVISEVRRRPALWDLSHSLYKDRDARQETWKGIYETLYPDFKHMHDGDRREIEKIVQQRWKTARDAYIRDKNVLRGGGRKKVYMYFDELRFLDKVHDKEEDSNNTATRHLPDEMDAISIDTPNVETYYCTPPTSTSNRDVDVQMNSSETGDSSRNTSDLYKKPKNLRKRKHSDSDFVKQIMTMFKDNVKLLKNEDLSFFMSLLPLMEQFSLHQKLIFRSEVLKKAMEIANLRNPYENDGDNSSRSCKLGNSDATSPKGMPMVSKDSTSTSVSRNYESPVQNK